MALVIIDKFKDRVIKVVKKIPSGKFLTYKQVAKLAGKEKAFRVVGNLMMRNKDKNVLCHRVIKSDYTVGGYLGREDLDWLKAALLLKEGAIGVIPTDTIYGICTSAFNKKSVEKVYKLRKRNLKKPCIILISDIKELKLFGVKLKNWQKNILEKIWPAKISVILPCQSKKFSYLHRGTNTLAFRLPKDKFILKILKVSGPLIAPSANWEGYEPAKTIKEAKKYFNDKVFYLDRGKIASEASTLIDLTQKEIKIIRKGADYRKIKLLLRKTF
ncbi:Threonylcarbamoyl-AMP synthase [bacterium HR35]|nr:Threonylcarbamoyl-AMP synthase [bacterium HR35]